MNNEELKAAESKAREAHEAWKAVYNEVVVATRLSLLCRYAACASAELQAIAAQRAAVDALEAVKKAVAAAAKAEHASTRDALEALGWLFPEESKR